MVSVSNPGPVPTVAVSTVRVYAAGAPVSYADLDLSGACGATKAICILQIMPTAACNQIQFRTNGEVVLTNRQGIAGMENEGSTAKSYLTVVTDENGLVEWICSAGDGQTIDVVAWWKAAS